MKEHLVIKSDFDKLPIDVMVIRPAHPKGIVQIAHGMCEHKERYEDFMNDLCQAGYVCLIHDHRGHGKSIRNQNDLGYFYHDGQIGIVEDVHQLTLWIRHQYPTLPLYLFGHSMGSLVVRCYTKKYDKDIDGLFVCGSPSYNPAASMGQKLAQFLNKIKGDHYHSRLIQWIGFEAFNKNFEKVPNSWICSDQEVVKKYNEDPLCSYTFSVNGFECLFRLMQQTYSKDNWNIQNKDIPIQFIAGEKDPCIVSPQKFKVAYTFMKDIGYPNVKGHLFKNMRHEILNETHKKQVYQFILQTINTWEK